MLWPPKETYVDEATLEVGYIPNTLVSTKSPPFSLPGLPSSRCFYHFRKSRDLSITKGPFRNVQKSDLLLRFIAAGKSNVP